MKKYDIIVIGGDAAGMSAASQARRQSKDLAIAVFEKGVDVSYAACGMPYFISGKIKDSSALLAIDREEFEKKRKIEIHTGHEVIGVSFRDRTVTVRSEAGTDEYSYGKLVIATGARSVVPPIRGVELDNIFTLRVLQDGMRIKKHVMEKRPRSALIMGGGFIGLEMAESFRALGMETTIVEKMESVAMTMSPVIREIIKEKLVDNGVELHFSEEVRGFRQAEGGMEVELSKQKVRADMVLVSVGVRPNTEFLRGTELAMDDRGVIMVNEKSETNIEGVYAAGDCASVTNMITGRQVYMPLATTANKQGRVAGLQAAGVADERFPGIVGSQFVKVFDLEVGKTGFNGHDAEAAGIPHKTIEQSWKSRAGYCPDSEKIVVTMTVDSGTNAIIGGEVAGTDGAALRVNAIAVAISAKMKVEDFAYLDLGYAPPFSPVWDSLLAAAQALKRES